jgi:hypothetical protein
LRPRLPILREDGRGEMEVKDKIKKRGEGAEART